MPCHHGNLSLVLDDKCKYEKDDLCEPFSRSTWKPSNMTRAILASVVPGAVGLICYKPFYGQKRAIDFWNVSSKKPNWAPKSLRFYACVDALTISPIGYASYLVYEHGGGFANRNTAISLGLNGGSLAFGLASIPFMNRKDLESVDEIDLFTHCKSKASVVYI
ncbi:unnamed protein product [Thelazia callipaeda]|uniref:DUF1279 domain-containing protein n=1 Tax=Thelazia callipaeda TaxID=103827 RepID=A0A0N5CPD8_THECL|nr:unnamed protein product [Thelazia callipaeda]